MRGNNEIKCMTIKWYEHKNILKCIETLLKIIFNDTFYVLVVKHDDYLFIMVIKHYNYIILFKYQNVDQNMLKIN